MFFTWYQSLHVDGCTFRNLTLPQSAEAQCVFDNAGAYSDNTSGGGDGSSTATPATGQQQELTSENRLIVIDGCANLMACLDDTICSITNSCVNQMEMTAQSVVFIEILDTAKFYFNNNYIDVDVGGGNIDVPDCELAAGPPKVLNRRFEEEGEDEGIVAAEEEPGGAVAQDVIATATTYCLDGIKVFDDITNTTNVTYPRCRR